MAQIPDHIKKTLDAYVQALAKEINVKSAFVFGSYARGKATEDSDVDLLVIMDHDKPRNVDQAIAIRLQTDAPFPMDLLVKRPSEVAERLAMNDTFIMGILDDGEVLYE